MHSDFFLVNFDQQILHFIPVACDCIVLHALAMIQQRTGSPAGASRMFDMLNQITQRDVAMNVDFPARLHDRTSFIGLQTLGVHCKSFFCTGAGL